MAVCCVVSCLVTSAVLKCCQLSYDIVSCPLMLSVVLWCRQLSLNISGPVTLAVLCHQLSFDISLLSAVTSAVPSTTIVYCSACHSDTRDVPSCASMSLNIVYFNACHSDTCDIVAVTLVTRPLARPCQRL